jgi:phage baseplate assembly protein W
MTEQVLFTAPGERVNRPDFGCGRLNMVLIYPPLLFLSVNSCG